MAHRMHSIVYKFLYLPNISNRKNIVFVNILLICNFISLKCNALEKSQNFVQNNELDLKDANLAYFALRDELRKVLDLGIKSYIADNANNSNVLEDNTPALIKDTSLDNHWVKTLNSNDRRRFVASNDHNGREHSVKFQNDWLMHFMGNENLLIAMTHDLGYKFVGKVSYY